MRPMLVIFAVAAVAMTLAGGLVPEGHAAFSRSGMRRMFALRAGILLAVAFTEILPEAFRTQPYSASWGALGAFVLLFVAGSLTMSDTCPEYLQECRAHALGAAAFVGLFGHSFIDGANLSASFGAGKRAGVAVGIALALHKLVDGFTLSSLLRQSGASKQALLAGLLLIALATPLGAGLAAAGAAALAPLAAAGWLGFAGGCFIYISATDLTPLLHRGEDRSPLAFFGIGLLGLPLLKAL